MNYRLIAYIIRQVFKLLICAMGVPIVFGIFAREYNVVSGFSITIIILIGIISILSVIKIEKKNFYPKEGFVVVALSWVLISFFGALSLFFSGVIPSFIDAFFESVSCFTTSGSSIITNINAVPKTILLWRSFTQWLGGMGILVFIIAILPSSGLRTQHVMRAESPGPSKGKLVPKLKDTATFLYTTYIVLTILQFISLVIAKMPVFDSVLITFATAATGGFAGYKTILEYNNPAAQWIITVFLVAFGINFQIYFFIIMQKVKSILKSEELIWYLIIYFSSFVLVAYNLYSSGKPLEPTVRESAFEVASIMTTAGFSSSDYTLWPSFSRSILFVLMIIGGCGGSVSGGIKVSRVILIFKNIKRQMKKIIYSKSVSVIKMDGNVVDEGVISATSNYLLAYFVIIIISYVLVSIDGFSFETTFSAVISAINDIGPGFGDIGPKGNWSEFSNISKIILSGDMLIGRLEIFPMLMLFSPSVWKNN